MPNTVHDRRVLARWRARAAASGLSVGAMIFCAGAGIAVPISLNAAALSALPALALAALCAVRAQRVLARPSGQTRALARGVWALLALTLALCGAYAVAALVNLAGSTLLTQARVGWICAVTLAALLLCGLCGSAAVARMCFLVRWALPALLVALGAKALQKGTPVGFFPVLGAGLLPLAGASGCMLCAAVPALLPLCFADGEDGKGEIVPPARFFVLRVLAGGGAGVVLLLSLTMCNTYDTLRSIAIWGDRMMVTCTHEPRMGLIQMLLILTQMLALSLCAAALLTGAQQAASQALRRRGRLPLAVSFAVTAAALLAMELNGFNLSVYAAPALIPLLFLLLALAGRLRAKARPAKGDERT